MAVHMIFPNFAVADIQRATDYYLGLGFTQNKMFSDESTSCIEINDQVAIMLLENDRFDSFLRPGQQRAAVGQVETLTAVLLGSRAEVDEFGQRVAASGGTLSKAVEEGEWGMYGGQATDPDGHVLDFFHMEPPTA